MSARNPNFVPSGIIVPMITPFKGKEMDDIDHPTLERLTEYLIENGVDALMVNGTSGEFLLQNSQERKSALRSVIRACRGRIPVIAGISEGGTKNAVDLGVDALEARADAVISTGPIYYKTSADGLYQHFQSIIDRVNLPLMIYNIPSWVGYNIPPTVVKELVDKNPGRVAGVKFTTNDLEQFLEYLRLLKDRISIMIGSDALIFSALELGAAGGVVGSANVLPKETSELYDNFAQGNKEKAREIQAKIDGFARTMTIGTYPSALKEAMRLLGLDCGLARPPLVPLGQDEAKMVEESLHWKLAQNAKIR